MADWFSGQNQLSTPRPAWVNVDGPGYLHITGSGPYNVIIENGTAIITAGSYATEAAAVLAVENVLGIVNL